MRGIRPDISFVDDSAEGKRDVDVAGVKLKEGMRAWAWS
jgi:hypothetical protein